MKTTPAKALRLQEGDMLVFETDLHFNADQKEQIHEEMRQALPAGCCWLLMGPGLRLSEIHTGKRKISEAVQAAVSAERERCAALCDEHAQSPFTNKSRKAAAKYLAREIRSGATES